MRRTAIAVALLLGCGSGSSEPDARAVTSLFTLVVIADTHVTGAGDRADKLATAIEWINAEAEARAIELVVVVGWDDGSGMARDLWSGLPPRGRGDSGVVGLEGVGQ